MTDTASNTAPATPPSPVAATPGGADPANGKKVLYWHDPMVPGQKFDQPGKSPFMDMELVPVYADGAGDEGKISISPRVQQNLGVRTAEVKQGALTPTIEAVGSVAYNERDVAVVQARANGFVERLFVRAPLDRVRKGVTQLPRHHGLVEDVHLVDILHQRLAEPALVLGAAGHQLRRAAQVRHRGGGLFAVEIDAA